jgi:hypothetical protein
LRVYTVVIRKKRGGLFMLTQNVGAISKTPPAAALGAVSEDEAARVDYYSGQALRYIREKLGVRLCEVERATKIRTSQLEDIEKERFDRLPQEVYVSGHVAALARHLALDPARVVCDYMARYRHWKAGK